MYPYPCFFPLLQRSFFVAGPLQVANAGALSYVQRRKCTCKRKFLVQAHARSIDRIWTNSLKVLNVITCRNGPTSTWITTVFKTRWRQQQPRTMTRRLLTTIGTLSKVRCHYAIPWVACLTDDKTLPWFMQPLLTRMSGRLYPFTESKSQLCSEICRISRTHTRACMNACQTATQMTPASATHVNSSCKSCNSMGNMYQICYR